MLNASAARRKPAQRLRDRSSGGARSRRCARRAASRCVQLFGSHSGCLCLHTNAAMGPNAIEQTMNTHVLHKKTQRFATTRHMIYRLPPLNALRVFEAAARHLLHEAANELYHAGCGQPPGEKPRGIPGGVVPPLGARRAAHRGGACGAAAPARRLRRARAAVEQIRERGGETDPRLPRRVHRALADAAPRRLLQAIRDRGARRRLEQDGRRRRARHRGNDGNA